MLVLKMLGDRAIERPFEFDACPGMASPADDAREPFEGFRPDRDPLPDPQLYVSCANAAAFGREIQQDNGICKAAGLPAAGRKGDGLAFGAAYAWNDRLQFQYLFWRA